MKTFCIALVFGLSQLLTGCGSGSEKDADETVGKASPSIETPAGIPNYTNWQKFDNAVDKCQQADPSNVLCQTEFTAGQKNCGSATFHFVAIKNGYMYVQTLENVIIRQGQFHMLTFDQNAEIYNITDESAEEYYSVFRCYGVNGEVVRL